MPVYLCESTIADKPVTMSLPDEIQWRGVTLNYYFDVFIVILRRLVAAGRSHFLQLSRKGLGFGEWKIARSRTKESAVGGET